MVIVPAGPAPTEFGLILIAEQVPEKEVICVGTSATNTVLDGVAPVNSTVHGTVA